MARSEAECQDSGAVPGRSSGRRRLGWRLAVVLVVAAVAAVVVGQATVPRRSRKSGATEPATRTGSGAGTVRALDPAYFTTGSCESFPPTSGDRHLTVFLDAGHGGIDPGAVGTTEGGQTVYEAGQTLPVVVDATALLRHDGFTVVDSRTKASTVVRLAPADFSGPGVLSVEGVQDDIAGRDMCANLAHAAIPSGCSSMPEGLGRTPAASPRMTPTAPFRRRASLSPLTSRTTCWRP